MRRTQANVCAVHGAFSGSRWKEFRVFLASAMPSADFACAKVSAALRVRTLFGSLTEGDGDGWADQEGAADVALFSACVVAFAGMVLLPMTGCMKFLRECDKRVCMLGWERKNRVYTLSKLGFH